MKKPLVSLVIPVYNVEKYLNKCLDSVINQTYQNIEIIIIDDGSSDKSKEISMSYAENDCRIKFISKENEGQGATRNLGVRMASGEYLAFLDSDDWLDAFFVEKMIERALRFEADVVTCDISYDILDGGEVKETISRLRLNSHNVVHPKLDKSVINKCRAFLWGKLYKMEYFRELEIVQPHHPYEDLSVMPLIIAKAKNLVHVAEPLIHYLRNRSDNTVDNLDFLFFISKALNNLVENFKGHGLFDEYYEELKMFAYSQVRVGLKKHALHSNDSSSFQELQKEFFDLMDRNFNDWVNIFELKCVVVGPVELKNAFVNLLLDDENLCHINIGKKIFDNFYDVDLIVIDNANKDILNRIEYGISTKIISVDCNLNEADSETLSWDLSDQIFYRVNADASRGSLI